MPAEQEQLNILKSIGCDGVIVRKAIYEGRIKLQLSTTVYKTINS